jgi:hypothetical protein
VAQVGLARLVRVGEEVFIARAVLIDEGFEVAVLQHVAP